MNSFVVSASLILGMYCTISYNSFGSVLDHQRLTGMLSSALDRVHLKARFSHARRSDVFSRLSVHIQLFVGDRPFGR
ncbi:hypothetical protein GALMADRAFT_247670 [Galerina marginata CBS 339.88]|uniref:Uncharacterized protein n=1 Tax=Galerina marginata (strain CBS 339.88) TaxID=685588 RepID=A0A067SZE2_GALM3|nr:hypothetical protein GALMADRAFT_247670 [Galerina marginata CBS 339.88]